MVADQSSLLSAPEALHLHSSSLEVAVVVGASAAMLPSAFSLKGHPPRLLSSTAVRLYRHYGVLLIENYLTPEQVQQLKKTCSSATRQRGPKVFPDIDAEHQHGTATRLKTEVREKQAPSPSPSPLSIGAGPLPPDVAAAAAEVDRLGKYEKRVQKLHLTLRNRRQVEKAFRRVTQMRDRYSMARQIETYSTAEEEASGVLTDKRIAEVQAKYSYEDVKRSFHRYRDSGHLEKDIRRDHHINEALLYMQNWPRSWCWLSASSPSLAALVAAEKSPIGSLIGDAAGQLSGEVVLRFYSDNAAQSSSFSNATPFGFAAIGTNVAHPNAMSVVIGLEEAPRGGGSGASYAILPGSHHVVLQLTDGGRELDRCITGAVFDAGKMICSMPELGHLPMVEVPPLSPGSAMFLNDYTMMATLPNLTGVVSGRIGSVADASASPSTYSMSLIPDRCAFDGRRNSWASRDTHGPLHRYQQGQLLIDDSVFPVLHRALDVE